MPLLRRASPPVVLLGSHDFFAAMRWIDQSPLLDRMEPYRIRLFERFFDERDDAGNLRYNLGLFGRAKKNWKSSDLILACYLAMLIDSSAGNQVYIVANDRDQAADDLELAKKMRKANPLMADWTTVKKNIIERKDGKGFIEVLASGDAVGSHGKTYRLLACDEVHGYRNWDLLEALAPDPTRRDTQQWITSYASIYHRPGVPLFDMLQTGKSGTDERMLLSWYAGDFTTDPAFADLPPDQRANPSMASWGDGGEYLIQQRRRLPAHKFRRLHLNLPGTPEGSAFAAEVVMDSIPRGVQVRTPERGLRYHAFVDMSGGSSDDAVLAISHEATDGKIVLDRVVNQGQQPPFDPNAAVKRFAAVLREYRVSTVTGDKYAGETFVAAFGNQRIGYVVSEHSKSELYEAAEPLLNARKIALLDVPTLEEQMLGLVWRGGKIDHPAGEHDDWANAAIGAVIAAADIAQVGPLDPAIMKVNLQAPPTGAASAHEFYGGSSGRAGSSLEDLAYGPNLGLSDLAKNAYGD